MEKDLNENLFNYIVVFAFVNSYIYGHKKELKVDEIIEYYNYIFSKLEKRLTEDKKTEINYIHNIFNTSSTETISKLILTFIKKYNNFFEIRNHGTTIKFKDENIDGEALVVLKDDIFQDKQDEYDYTYIISIIASYECDLQGLQILGATSMLKQLNTYLKIEEKLERLYSNYEINQKEITTYMLIITNFINKLANLNNYSILFAYDRLLNEIKYNRYKYNDIELIDREKINKFPDIEHILINSLFETPFQRAIFTEDDLFPLKATVCIENIIDLTIADDPFEFDDLFDEEDEDFLEDEEDFEDIPEEEELNDNEIKTREIQTYNYFYLSYIEEIDKYVKENPEDNTLNQVKSRLLYLLANPFYNLSQSESRQNYLKNLSIEPSSEELYDYLTVSQAFLLSLIENKLNDKNSLRKILYILTYYNITHSEQIISLIIKYQKTKVGKLLYDYIFNNIPIKIPDKTKPNNIKKKIKDIFSKHTNEDKSKEESKQK